MEILALTITLTDFLLIGVALGALLILVVAYVQFRAKLNGILKNTTLQESEFESQLEAEAHGVDVPTSRPPATAPAAPVVPAESFPPAGAVEMIVHQLTGLGVLEEKQGVLTLAAPPEGAIYRMRGGGSCAILPRMESQAAMEHFCRRFDMVFYASAEGDTMVSERFQHRLPSLLSPLGDPR